MRNLLLLSMGLILLATTAVAQNNNKVDLFGGYQYSRVNPGEGASGLNFNGWNAAVTGYVNKWFGITGDISGAYKEGVHFHSFMGGVTVAPAHQKTVSPFVHALFGGVHGSGGGFSDNAFSMALGGGIDIHGHGHFGFRPIQADYAMTRFFSTTQNNVRISTGILISF